MSENKINKKSIQFWVGVNKNGFIGLHTSEPVKNKKTGKWESGKMFCNCNIQIQIEELVRKTNMNWESECEFFEIIFE